MTQSHVTRASSCVARVRDCLTPPTVITRVYSMLENNVCAGRGGQSALRFARLRLEKRHNYVRKVAETMVQCFITEDQVNVEGLILAGSADFKTELSQSDMFDQVRHPFYCFANGIHTSQICLAHRTAFASQGDQDRGRELRQRGRLQSGHRARR